MPSKYLFFILLLTTGCSSSTPPAPEETSLPQQRREQQRVLLNKIHIGTTQEQVEALLGQPMSTTESAEGISVSYMLGMPDMRKLMDQAMAASRVSQGASLAQGALGMLSAVGGAASMGAGSAAIGVGSSLLGEGAAMMGSVDAATMTPPDMSQMQMINIVYKDAKVATITKTNPGAMMGGADGQTMGIE